MSQERVLTLLYDKTFPPRSQSTGFTGQMGGHMPMQKLIPSGSMSTKIGLKSVDSMRQFNVFNYHGQYEQKLGQTGVPYEEDIELLEREIDNAIRAGSSTGPARGGSFVDKRIINMSVGVNRNRT